MNQHMMIVTLALIMLASSAGAGIGVIILNDLFTTKLRAAVCGVLIVWLTLLGEAINLGVL